ncbi:Diaminopimelate epimerase-like protein [Meredithblackwellia eburnea MCA 4105]
MGDTLEYFLIDSFTKEAYSGNPASVVLLPPSPTYDDSFYLRISREFNLSETAFVAPLPSQQDDLPTYNLRWWTPSIEFPLCGHATLATAWVLFNHVLNKDQRRIRFETPMSGTLWATNVGTVSETKTKIELDFPADSVILSSLASANRTEQEERLHRAMGTLPCNSDRPVLKLLSWAKGRLCWIVEVAVEEGQTLEEVALDVKGFKELGGYVVFTHRSPTSPSSPPTSLHIVSRVLDPFEDVQEDPVTGSAHCALAPFYLAGYSSAIASSPENGPKFPTIFARQGHRSRQGTLEVEWDPRTGRCTLRGEAVQVMRGSLSVPPPRKEW